MTAAEITTADLAVVLDIIGLSASGYLLVSLVILLAAIVQASLGMGFGQVAAPLLLLIDLRFVPGPILLMTMVVALLGAISGRRDIVAGELGSALLGRVLGAILAGYLLQLAGDADVFARLFAVLVLIAVLLSLWRPLVRMSKTNLLLAGTASGLMGTITSIGAPPMGLVYQSANPAHVRATLSAFFALGTVASLVALAVHGHLGWHDALLAAALAPAFILGTALSRLVRGSIDKRFRVIVLMLAGLAAILILVRSFS